MDEKFNFQTYIVEGSVNRSKLHRSIIEDSVPNVLCTRPSDFLFTRITAKQLDLVDTGVSKTHATRQSQITSISVANLRESVPLIFPSRAGSTLDNEKGEGGRGRGRNRRMKRPLWIAHTMYLLVQRNRAGELRWRDWTGKQNHAVFATAICTGTTTDFYSLVLDSSMLFSPH